MGKLYDSDFCGWTIQRADALKRKSLNDLDWENLTEEIETLGRSETRELGGCYRLLLLHLRRWQFQPMQRSRSWKAARAVQRKDASQALADNPSLKRKADEIFAATYELARVDAAQEPGVKFDTFPPTAPYTCALPLDQTFFPGPVE